MAKKACKNCRLLVGDDKDHCPACKGTTFVPNWKGRIYIMNPNESQVAEKVGITAKGEYAIKAV